MSVTLAHSAIEVTAGLTVVVTRRLDGLMVKQRLLEANEPAGRRTIT